MYREVIIFLKSSLDVSVILLFIPMYHSVNQGGMTLPLLYIFFNESHPEIYINFKEKVQLIEFE